MSSRERILDRVRTNRRGNMDANEPAPDNRLFAAPAANAPLAAQFLEHAARLGSDVAQVPDLAQVPAAIVRYLDAHSLSRVGACWPELLPLPWQESNIRLEARAARADDAIGITTCFAALAETGTLMLTSGPRTPATVSLLPETHIAVVSADRIVATMEDAWVRLRAAGPTPRAVNFVSGPSRTADVEQTVTLGAHGPRRALIVLVGN